MLTEMRRAVWEKILAERFGGDVARADIGAPIGRQALLVAGGRQHAVKIHLGIRGNEIAGAVVADDKPVDLLDQPGAVRGVTVSRWSWGCAGRALGWIASAT